MSKVIMSCPGVDVIKNKIIQDDFKKYGLGSKYIFLDIIWDHFPDGNPNNRFKNPGIIKNSDVYFIADFEDTKNCFEYLSLIYAIPHYGARSLTVFIPYFSTATMERVGEPGQIATAKTLMRMLNAIPHCHGSGPARIIIYDIHSLAVQHFHGDGIIIELQSVVPFFLNQLKWPPKFIFAFPDEGARKRFHTFFPDPCIICSKDENRHVTIKEGLNLIDENHVIIIDDMVRNGDTTINCYREIKHHGAAAVSAYVTHGVFPQESWRKFFDVNFDSFWVTDTCNASRELEYGREAKPSTGPIKAHYRPQSFKFLSISKLIEEEIEKS